MARMQGSTLSYRVMIASFVLALSVASPLRAREGAEHLALMTITEAWQAVTGELRSHGVQEAQLPRLQDIDLPLAVPARTGRKLHVASVCWDSNAERARFRLQCESSACLPFLAYVRVGEGAREPSCLSASRAHAVATTAPPAVRAGSKATAILVTQSLRMTAAVTCLDHGDQGGVVRVRGQLGRVFRARVVGPALVEVFPQ